MFELKKLYVIEFKGKKHYFANEGDANFWFNLFPSWDQKEMKAYTIKLTED